ncbi:hypothetical protein ACOSQ4_011747 [Xanthoceras sorbifolium]
MGKFLRIRVNIDISKPLKRGIRVSLNESEESIMLLIRYERLLEYCFGCGMVGHHVHDCPSVSTDADFVQTDIGPWLRASSPGKSCPVRETKGSAAPLTQEGNTAGLREQRLEVATAKGVQGGEEAGSDDSEMHLPKESEQISRKGKGKILEPVILEYSPSTRIGEEFPEVESSNQGESVEKILMESQDLNEETGKGRREENLANISSNEITVLLHGDPMQINAPCNISTSGMNVDSMSVRKFNALVSSPILDPGKAGRKPKWKRLARKASIMVDDPNDATVLASQTKRNAISSGVDVQVNPKRIKTELVVYGEERLLVCFQFFGEGEQFGWFFFHVLVEVLLAASRPFEGVYFPLEGLS